MTHSSFPQNCRVFIGNLASERTSAAELRDIFSKHGKIMEDIVMHRSFGFVQYDNPQSAAAAISAENGRMIGGLRIDLSIATASRSKSRDEKDRSRRSASPPRSRDHRDGRSSRDRDSHDSRGSKDARDGKDISERERGSNKPVRGQIIHIGQVQRAYVMDIHERIQSRLGLNFEVVFLDRLTIAQALEQSVRQGNRFAIVAGGQNEKKNTLNLNILRQSPGRQDRLLADISLRECLEEISHETGISLRDRDAPQHLPPQPVQAAQSLGGINPNAALLLTLAGQMDSQQQASFAALLPVLLGAMAAPQQQQHGPQSTQLSTAQAQPPQQYPSQQPAQYPQYSQAPQPAQYLPQQYPAAQQLAQSATQQYPYPTQQLQYAQRPTTPQPLPQVPPQLLQQPSGFAPNFQQQSQPPPLQQYTAVPNPPQLVQQQVLPPVQPSAQSQPISPMYQFATSLSSLLGAYAANNAAQPQPNPSASLSAVASTPAVQSVNSHSIAQSLLHMPAPPAFPKIGVPAPPQAKK